MTPPQDRTAIVDRLEAALDNGSIPSTHRKWGNHLLSHLCKPLQIGVVGLCDSGKSSIISLILGRTDLPALAGVGLVEIAHGPDLCTVVEHAGGTFESFDGLVDVAPDQDDVIRVRLELPDAALNGCCFVEARLAGSAIEQRDMLNNVCQSSAILVYCSEEFGAEEQRLWSGVPEQTKDHSFLALTKADRLIMKGTLTDKIEEIAAVAMDEFFGLHPIATLQAIAARAGGETVSPELWDNSGGKDLYEVLRRQIDDGRAEDIDQAEMLLAQYADQIAPETTSGHIATAEISRNMPAAEAVTDASAALKYTLDVLEGCSDDLLNSFSEVDEIDPPTIIERCSQAIIDITEFLEEVECDDPDVARLQEDARQGEHLLLLMQLENDEEAATDAVSLLTQLRKEISKRACG